MLPPDDRDPVDVLAEEFADRLRRGEYPSVGDYAAAHPEHADQLRELLPAVAQMESLKRFRRTAVPDGHETVPDRFGDFRIVRELGRGGMGVVFEAVQESLGRPVALKVLSSHAQLDEKRRERFVREAQAAAKLHHTNIVPVFGVGEQDGLPYYVMQLIRGEGLHAVARRWRRERRRDEVAVASTVAPHETGGASTEIDDAPTPTGSAGPRYGDWAFVAEVGAQAADALHDAHRQGVLHRDVKPANLILDPVGRVWVADFGLAKIVNHDGLTASGDILGTLQYMPPESLTGSADPRGDVYGLGATLYELLTLEPPYPLDSPAKLIKQVADTEPVPPRQINPAIPRDLETIVLKAMAREPGRRYASALEMARDLQAFLEDRPIKARRQTALARGWRWCRRNPAVAVLTANTVAAVVLAGAVGWAGYVRTKHALDKEAQQLAEANKARADAEKAQADAVAAAEKLDANLQMSLEAFEAVFDAVGGRSTFVVRGFGPGPPGGPFGVLLGGGGGFWDRSGFSLPGLGPPPKPGGGPSGPPGGPGGPGGPAEDEKTAVLDAVLAFYDKYAERNTNAASPQLQFQAARASRRVAEVQSFRGNTEKAAVSFRRAAGLLEGLLRKNPADENARGELVQTYLNAPPDAFADYEGKLARARELAVGLKPPHDYLAGSVLLKLGWLRGKNGDAAGAEWAYREAIDALAPRAGGPDTRSPMVVTERATTRLFLAALLTDGARHADARRVLEESLPELRPFAERSRELGRMPLDLVAATNLRLADVCARLGDKGAEQAARDAVKHAQGQIGPGGFGGHDGRGGFGGGGGFGGPKKDGPPPRKN